MSANQIFGVIVAGRLIQTDFVQAGETEFVCEIPNADAINHLVVFLTGVQPFPDGMGGSVFIRWPQDSGEVNWHYLGFIANEKPSAIFKVAQLHKATSDHSADLFSNHGPGQGVVGSALIGVMVEPLRQIEEKVAAEGTSTTQQSTIAEFSEKMLSNFVNHVSSYVVSFPDPMNPSHATEYIPIKSVNDWFSNFKRRLQFNPNFWKSIFIVKMISDADFDRMNAYFAANPLSEDNWQRGRLAQAVRNNSLDKEMNVEENIVTKFNRSFGKEQ
ncbi:unnamed protein product [Bursaphelenchus okinawaensis]|uniref:DUF775 domain-containing protein n=1 Tax=Bursaphelenchus okinawaensis TaxID=465554 RepID=A0A811LDY4_9BILA|nr:unnamed protein product [Bursaphelenchus okinawaensis]CAG9121296.1 unnamed protein product [Bursaphelenchus okinawaensis]